MLEILSQFDSGVYMIGAYPSEIIDEEGIEALQIVRQKILTTIAADKKGELLYIGERLEFLKPEELDELKKSMKLEEKPLIEIGLAQSWNSPICDYTQDVTFMGARKFKTQPNGSHHNLVMICIEMDHGLEYAVGLVTQQELDMLAHDLDQSRED